MTIQTGQGAVRICQSTGGVCVNNHTIQPGLAGVQVCAICQQYQSDGESSRLPGGKKLI